MKMNKHYVLGLALSFTLVACGKEEKTKTVTVENPKTVEELKAAQKERDELKEKLKLVGDVEALKTDLEKANAKVEELNKSLSTKDEEIQAAKKDLEEARKAGDAKVGELETKVKDLEAEKEKLTKDLEAAQGDKTKLAALVEAAQRDEVMYKNILDYAVAHGAKDRDAIAAALDKDLADIEAALKALVDQEAGLKDAITTQAQVVVKAAADLENVSKNMKGIYTSLSERSAKGEILSAADQTTYETLKAYFEAASAEEAEKKTRDGIEQAIDGLNKELAGLNSTLVNADAELKKFNEELLALALTDTKLESARAKELTTLIEARKLTIAETTVAKEEKSKALAEQLELLKTSKDTIEDLVNVQAEKLAAYKDTAVSAAREALTQAEKDLDVRVAAYQTNLKDAAVAQGKKADLTAMKDFFTSKLKPAQA